MRSRNWSPRLVYFFAMLTTSLRFASISSFFAMFARVSPSTIERTRRRISSAGISRSFSTFRTSRLDARMSSIILWIASCLAFDDRAHAAADFLRRHLEIFFDFPHVAFGRADVVDHPLDRVVAPPKWWH